MSRVATMVVAAPTSTTSSMPLLMPTAPLGPGRLLLALLPAVFGLVLSATTVTYILWAAVTTVLISATSNTPRLTLMVALVPGLPLPVLLPLIVPTATPLLIMATYTSWEVPAPVAILPLSSMAPSNRSRGLGSIHAWLI